MKVSLQASCKKRTKKTDWQETKKKEQIPICCNSDLKEVKVKKLFMWWNWTRKIRFPLICWWTVSDRRRLKSLQQLKLDMEKEFEMSDYLGDEILFQMKLISVVYSFLKKIYLGSCQRSFTWQDQFFVNEKLSENENDSYDSKVDN